LQELGKDIHHTSLEEMDKYWDEAKERERSNLRLDKFLKVSRLIRRRTLAKEVADQGRISVNGNKAKPGTTVSVGDEIAIQFGQKLVTVQVTSLDEVVKKDNAKTLYKVLKEEKVNSQKKFYTCPFPHNVIMIRGTSIWITILETIQSKCKRTTNYELTTVSCWKSQVFGKSTVLITKSFC